MAMRVVMDLPKFKQLQRRLGLRSKSEALGYLECMWHFTAKCAPRGDIGRYSDEEIEAWVEWFGEPGLLVKALVECRWLDAHSDPAVRLVVHDWSTHADRTLKRGLARHKLLFADGTEPPKGEKRDASGKVGSQSENVGSKKTTNHKKVCFGTPQSVARGQRPVASSQMPEPVAGEEACAEPSGSCAGGGARVVEIGEETNPWSGFVFPLKGGGEWALPVKLLAELEQTYPHWGSEAIRADLREARLWCVSHEAERKTATGMPRFVTGWLARTERDRKKRAAEGTQQAVPAKATGERSIAEQKTRVRHAEARAKFQSGLMAKGLGWNKIRAEMERWDEAHGGDAAPRGGDAQAEG